MSQETFLTDALIKRHQAETKALPENPPFNVMLEHASRQAKELVAHAYDLEKRLHAAWNEQRWEDK